MAKILFTWELGQGTGHTTPYIELISQLEDQGHEVSFALRSLHKAHDQFGGFKTTWYQAPLVLPRHVNVTMPINSYPKILHNNGYDNASRLASMIAAWKNLYALIDPDLLVFDYSPTAMLAARGSRARRIAIGTGFHLPPDVRPIPCLQYEEDPQQDESELLAFEDNLLRTINEALQLNELKPLTRFGELLDADEKLLRTLPEMDHYPNRPNAKYVGILKSPPGDEPVWPACPGPRVFAYLKPFTTLPMLPSVMRLTALRLSYWRPGYHFCCCPYTQNKVW